MSPSIFQTNLLIPILFLFSTTSQSLRFDLQTGHTKCISDDIKINALVVGKYTAVAPAAGPHFPDSHKITVRITSPSGKSIHLTDKVEYGNFAFTATETGDYLACFWAAEHKPVAMLGVEFDWRTGVAAKDWSNIAKKGHIDKDGWVVCRVFKKKNRHRNHHLEMEVEEEEFNNEMKESGLSNTPILERRQNSFQQYDFSLDNSMHLPQLLSPETAVEPFLPSHSLNRVDIECSQNLMKLVVDRDLSHGAPSASSSSSSFLLLCCKSRGLHGWG